MLMILKWVGIGLLCLVGLMAVIVSVVLAITFSRLNQVYSDMVPAIIITTDAVSIERSRYLAVEVSPCASYYGNDLIDLPAGPGGPAAPNFTQGGERVVWAEADFIKAFHTCGPQRQFNPEHMSIAGHKMVDNDLWTLVFYLKSLSVAQPAQ